MKTLALVAVLCALPLLAQEKTYVYVMPTSQTARTIREFASKCPIVSVTVDQPKAKYSVLLVEAGAGAARKDTDVSVFNPSGDVMFAGETRSTDSAVKDACAAIKKDLSKQSASK